MGDVPDEAMRLVQAFMFLIKTETYAVNHAGIVVNRELARGFDDADHTVMWEAMYGVLSHSANLSKIFWPPKGKKIKAYRVRGEALRAAFELAEDSPLRDRDVRNGFEHVDEWIHDWMAEPGTALVDQFIGPASGHKGHDGKYLLRTFDHETGIVTFGRSMSVALFPLVRENERLYDRWRVLKGLPPHITPEAVLD